MPMAVYMGDVSVIFEVGALVDAVIKDQNTIFRQSIIKD